MSQDTNKGWHTFSGGDVPDPVPLAKTTDFMSGEEQDWQVRKEDPSNMIQFGNQDDDLPVYHVGYPPEKFPTYAEDPRLRTALVILNESYRQGIDELERRIRAMYKAFVTSGTLKVPFDQEMLNTILRVNGFHHEADIDEPHT